MKSTTEDEANEMQAKATPSDLLTYRQAAELLNTSDRTVWNLVKAGKLAAVRFAGRTVRIDRRDLETFIVAAKGGGQ